MSLDSVRHHHAVHLGQPFLHFYSGRAILVQSTPDVTCSRRSAQSSQYRGPEKDNTVKLLYTLQNIIQLTTLMDCFVHYSQNSRLHVYYQDSRLL
jgi:hypothetical protein